MRIACRRVIVGIWIALGLTLGRSAPPALAQHEHHHPEPVVRDTVRRPIRATRHSAPRPTVVPAPSAAGHVHGESAAMAGLFGSYSATRDASGTSWQPDLAPHTGVHRMQGPWTTMVHALVDVVDDRQDGPRGAHRTFSSNMLMAHARRALGHGTLGFRAMLTAEPATIGKEGYPLLLQTGETADGRTPLIDRQHPHDLFMELAASWSLVAGKHGFYLYAGLPGEPALGPPAFMHRSSGVALPAAPLSHHWLDSSHISFGVLTVGAVFDWLKLEASAFRGREPDQHRSALESPKLDSGSFRVSANPAPDWSFQVSHGRLESPEQLEPEVDVDRTTLSVMREIVWPEVHGEVTLAWGRNDAHPGPVLEAFLAEGAVAWRDAHVLFARMEQVEKDELFPPGDPRAVVAYDVGAFTLGYRYDVLRTGPVRLGLGATGTIVQVPAALRAAYGASPSGTLLFVRATLQ